MKHRYSQEKLKTSDSATLEENEIYESANSIVSSLRVGNGVAECLAALMKESNKFLDDV